MIEEIDRVVKLMNFVLDKCSNKQLTYSLGSLPKYKSNYARGVQMCMHEQGQVLFVVVDVDGRMIELALRKSTTFHWA